MTSVKNLIGARSFLNLTITYKNDNTYIGNGWASFGVFDEHSITFDIIAGFCVPSCSDKASTFLTQAQINGGSGKYANASGILTSWRYYQHENSPTDMFVDWVNYVVSVKN